MFHTARAAARIEVKQRMMDWFGPVIYETYGGTEGGGARSRRPGGGCSSPAPSARPIHGVTIAHPRRRRQRAAARRGRRPICIESDSGRFEYYKDAGKTRAHAPRRRTDHRSATSGYLDDDGFLFLRDRKIDMIISGGVNIYPAEVEAALLPTPLIADAAVIGIPDDEWGEQVKAVVELRPGIAAHR